MDTPNRVLRVGLLIGGIVLADAALGSVQPNPVLDRDPGILAATLFLGLSVCGIAAIIIWLALGGPLSPRRVLVAAIAGIVSAGWCAGKLSHGADEVLLCLIVLGGFTLAVTTLFLVLRLRGLRIVPSEIATDFQKLSRGPMQFSLLGLLATVTVLGLLAALSKVLYPEIARQLRKDVLPLLGMHIAAYTALTPLAAWLAWSGRLAALRLLVVAAALAAWLWIAFARKTLIQPDLDLPLTFLGMTAVGYVVQLSVCLWLYRWCGYEAVWQGRGPSMASGRVR